MLPFLAGTLTSTWLAVRVHAFLSGRDLVRDTIDRARLSRRSLSAWAALARQTRQRSDVVVSLTTVPSRIELLAPTLASLLWQRVVPAGIELYLPERSVREARAYVLPAWLRRLSEEEGLVSIVPCDDLGPATKLLPALRRHAPTQRLLVVDDDVLVPPGFLGEIMSSADRLPEAIVAGSGWIVPTDLTDRPTTLLSNLALRAPTPIRGPRLDTPRRVDVVQGSCGYLVQPRFFAPEVHDFGTAPSAVRTVDDVWLSAHARAERWVVPLPRLPAPRGGARFTRSALGRVNRGPGSFELRPNTIAIRHFADRWMCAGATERTA